MTAPRDELRYLIACLHVAPRIDRDDVQPSIAAVDSTGEAIRTARTAVSAVGSGQIITAVDAALLRREHQAQRLRAVLRRGQDLTGEAAHALRCGAADSLPLAQAARALEAISFLPRTPLAHSGIGFAAAMVIAHSHIVDRAEALVLAQVREIAHRVQEALDSVAARARSGITEASAEFHNTAEGSTPSGAFAADNGTGEASLPVPEAMLLSRLRTDQLSGDPHRSATAAQALGHLEQARRQAATLGTTAHLVSYAAGHPPTIGISLGDPWQARRVAVVVPGTGSSMEGAWPEDRMDAIYRSATTAACAPISEMSRFTSAGSTSDTAVIHWVGYDAPDSLRDHHVGTLLNAEDGAQRLRSFLGDLDAARSPEDPSASLTVIGHSYGAVVAGTAARDESLAVSDLVLIGAPGAGVDHASQLKGTQRVWIGTNEYDPIDLADGWHDAAAGPSDRHSVLDKEWADGRTRRFATEDPSAPLRDRTGLPAHSSYFTSEDSLSNMGRIIAGHPEAVTAPTDSAGALEQSFGVRSMKIAAGMLYRWWSE